MLLRIINWARTMCSSPKTNQSAIKPDYKNYSLMAELSSTQRQRFTHVANNAAERRARLEADKRKQLAATRPHSRWQLLLDIIAWIKHPTFTIN